MYDLTVKLVRDGTEAEDVCYGWFAYSQHVPERILKNPRDSGRGDEDIYTFDVYERQDDGRYHFTHEEERFQYTGK